MSKNDQKLSISSVLGAPREREDILAEIKKNPSLYSVFQRFEARDQDSLLKFLAGEKSLEILYDPFFKYVMDPEIHPERLESLLSALFGQPVTICQVLPNEGRQLADNGSFVIMDILVELSDGTYVDVEMQKIGYQFPAQRSSCYASDVIMRQYNRVRAEKGKDFTYRDIQSTYLFIIMEKSSPEFLKVPEYIHRRTTSYTSGVNLPEIANITYVSLDTFKKAVQNVDTELDAWLTFLSRDDAEGILSLVDRYPQFLPYYSDIAEFRKKPEELIYMFSEALYILDRNTERFMVDELKKEVDSLKQDNDSLKQKNDSLNGQVNSLTDENVALSEKLSAYEAKFGTLNEQ